MTFPDSSDFDDRLAPPPQPEPDPLIPSANGAANANGAHAATGAELAELGPFEPPGGPEGAEMTRRAQYEQTLITDQERAIDRERIIRRAKASVDADELINPPGADLRRLRLTKASDFKIRAVRWLWEDRMPLGELTLVPGREGVGKSTFLAWLAAQVTRGELPGRWLGTKRSVLYAATEDSWESTIAPRMLAAGADMDLVYRIDVELTEGRYGKLSLPLDTHLLPATALEVDAAALMCDPIISVISDRVNTFKAQELRGALEPLRMAAEHARMAVVGLVHFNKGKDNDVLTAISGSRAYTEVARAVIAIARDKDADEYTCVVSQVKNNLGRADLANLAYTIEPYGVPAEDGETARVGRVRWTSHEYARSVEEILNPPKEPRKLSDVHVDVINAVTEEYAETGAAVPVKWVVQRLGGRYPENTIRQALTRAAGRDGTLRKIGYGLYAPPEEPVPMRMCPGDCGRALKADENFCVACRSALDRDNRDHIHALDDGSHRGDGLW